MPSPVKRASIHEFIVLPATTDRHKIFLVAAASSNDSLHAMPRQAGLLGVNAAVRWLRRRRGTDRRDRRLESVVMGRVVQTISALRGSDFGVAQICAATFSRPIMRASVRTSS